MGNAGTSVYLMAVLIFLLYQSGQFRCPFLPHTLWSDKPLIKSAAANFDRIAHLFNWKGIYMFTYELVFSQSPLEKMATAFFKIGRASCRETLSSSLTSGREKKT